MDRGDIGSSTASSAKFMERQKGVANVITAQCNLVSEACWRAMKAADGGRCDAASSRRKLESITSATLEQQLQQPSGCPGPGLENKFKILCALNKRSGGNFKHLRLQVVQKQLKYQ